MNHVIPYVRLSTYYSFLLVSDPETFLDFPFTLSSLSQITGIPIIIVRNDFLCIFQREYQIAARQLNENNFIGFDLENENYTVSPHIKELIESVFNGDSFPNEFEISLLNGEFDNIPFEANACFNKILLSLTAEEYLTLCNLDSSFLSRESKKKLPYHIKDNYFHRSYKNDLAKILQTFDDTITKKQLVKLNYRNRFNKIKLDTILPLKFFYDADENMYYIIDNKKSYRVDRIASVEPITDSKPDTAHLEQQIQKIEKISPNVWGSNFFAKPETVKVKFYHEANVWNKVRKDLDFRKNGKLYEDNNFLYYEDTVYGIEKFRSWIYSFGSSAVVLEPQHLRNEIIQSLKERQAEYASTKEHY